MASEEEAAHGPVSPSSSVRLEALFPAVETEQAGGDGNPELIRLGERLQVWLAPHEAAVLCLQRLLVWERPLHSVFAAFTLNTLFWLLSSTFLRPLFLISVCLLGLVLLDRWKDKLPGINVQYPEASIHEREAMTVRPRLLSIVELSHHLAESYLTCSLYIQEMLQYKRLNPGKFCMLMCAGCMILAVVGHYIPGIMISYIILISVLLWPLVVYHELIQKMYTGLEPILMKLDYSMKGGTQHRKHDKKKAKKDSEEGDEPQAETESESEEELSCFAPTVDVKTTALAMAITDSELSDEEASILESGGFSVSRATTPQLTDVSEDLDQQSIHSEPEEAYTRDLPDFPSVDEFSSIEHGLSQILTPLPGCTQGPTVDTQEGDPQSPTSLLFQHLASPLHFVNTHFNGHGQPGGVSQDGAEGMKVAPRGISLSLEALSKEIVSTAISTVVQNTLTAMLHSSEDSEGQFVPETAALQSTLFSETDLKGGTTATATMDTAGRPVEMHASTEEEDFELLDQSELEELDEALGLSSERQGSTVTESSHNTQQS